MLLIPVFVVTAQEKISDETAEILVKAKISQIIKNEKQLYGINLSEDEIKRALAFLLEKNGLTLSKFSEIAKKGRIIVDGLRLVADSNESSAEIYKKLKMESNGISVESWDYYVKTHSNDEKIKALEAIIPDTMEKVIASGAKQFGDQLSDWLLFRKIIMDFDAKFPEKKNMSSRQKEQQWWENSLKKYDLGLEQEEHILKNTSVSGKLSDNDAVFMEEFFSFENRQPVTEKETAKENTISQLEANYLALSEYAETDIMPLGVSFIGCDISEVKNSDVVWGIIFPNKNGEELKLAKFPNAKLWDFGLLYSKNRIITAITFVITEDFGKAKRECPKVIKCLMNKLGKNYHIKRVNLDSVISSEKGYSIIWDKGKYFVAIKFGPLQKDENKFQLQLMISSDLKHQNEILLAIDTEKPIDENNKKIIQELLEYFGNNIEINLNLF